MKHKTKTRALSWLLSLALMLSIFPGMSLTAYAAWDGDPYASLLNTTTVVKFDGKDWYLIENNSTALNAGTVTLLSKECVAASQYNSSGSFVEYSSNPTVKTAVDNWYNSNITADAKTAVSGGGMFLLTKDQANAMTMYTRRCSQFSGIDDNHWWLCSQGDGERALFVDGDGGGEVKDHDETVDTMLAVRPALKLNLESVIFSSVNLSGGANAAKSGGTATQNYFDMGNTRGAMTTVTYTANANYKFPESSELYKETNGITVARTSDTVITVSGTPTATATSIAVPNAVQASIAVTGISLDKTTAQTIELDGKVSFTATVAPDNATDKKVKWSVGGTDAGAVKLYSNEACTTEVGTDATETLTVYAKGISAGSATVTATSNADSTKTASCDVTVNEAQPSTYTLVIPSTLTVANSGWNATDGISATGTLASGKKLTVTASSDGEFALVSGTNNKVNYKLAASGDTTTTYANATEKTTWEFATLSDTAATQTMGIVVEDYSAKPAGTYQDTVTFTASVVSAS